MLGIEACRTDRRYANQMFKFVADAVEHGLDCRARCLRAKFSRQISAFRRVSVQCAHTEIAATGP